MRPRFPSDEDDGETICSVTGSYCMGLFCEDYGCAKEAGFYDTEDDDEYPAAPTYRGMR